MMKKNQVLLILRSGIFAALLLAGSIPSFARQAPNADPLEASVAELFQRSCTAAGCHSGPVPQMNMDLTSDKFYASIGDEASTEVPTLKRIDPGSPETSYLVKKIKGEEGIIGLPMPMTGDRLTDQEIATIESWISGLGEVDAMRK